MGEAALLSGAPRGATVVCKTTELTAMYLLKGDFDAVVADFPDVLDHIMEISNARKKATAAPPNKKCERDKGVSAAVVQRANGKCIRFFEISRQPFFQTKVKTLAKVDYEVW